MFKLIAIETQISYKSIPPNMQCHSWSNLNENPGEKYLRLFLTFETWNLPNCYNQKFPDVFKFYPKGIKMNSSVTVSKPIFNPKYV